MKVHSTESPRCDVTTADVNLFFNELVEALSKIRCYSLVINMDESGFSSRPQKDTSQNCCFLSNCPIPPTFREQRDASHISIVGAVSIDGRVLKPMLLSVNKNPPREIRGTFLENSFDWAQTPKGYMTHDSMISWVHDILISYVSQRRAELNDDDLNALLIFDGLKTHLMDDIKDEHNQHRIMYLCLPPHSSHLLQVMDLSIFSPMKTYYRNMKPKLFEGEERKMAKKVEKIIKSYYQATYEGNIYSGWEECGIKLNFENGDVTNVFINRAKVLAKLGK